MKNSNGRRREPTWEDVSKISQRLGWFTQVMTKDKIIFERGRQRIEAKRVPSLKMWKVEYYSGYIMDDTTGVELERAAKIDAIEMAVLK